MANQFLAAVLSFFIPGLGQFYAGHLMRGILVFILAVILYAITAFTFFVGLVAFIFVVWNIIDAYQLAGRS